MESQSNSNGITMESKALELLREGLSDVLKPDVTDSVLMKWLRTNSFNIEKTTHLYKEYIWTKLVYQTDDLENYKMPEVLQKYRFNTHLGYAKDGCPISYISVGRGDFKGFVNSLDVVEICKYGCYVVEKDLKRCQEQSKKLGKDINSITYIADFEHFSIRQILAPGMIEMGFDMFRVLQDHYPEIWNHILVINIPYYFATLFKIFKPCLRNTFIQKIHLASKDNSANLLLRFIDPEELPAFLGGKLVDSNQNPMCNEFINFGGTISQAYYRNNKLKLSPTEPGVVDIWIPPRSCYNTIFVVREAYSTFRIECVSEGGSIKGRILYKEFPEDTEKLDLPSTTENLDPNCNSSPWKGVSPFININAHVVPLDYTCLAPWAGIYVFKFDNIGSWLSGRRAMIKAALTPPERELRMNVLQNG